MGTYLLITPKEDELYHFGIKGMKWGIRRFQPYQKGEKVKGGKEVGAATKVKQRPSAGNIIEKYKAHKVGQKKAAAVKKAQATRKAKADFEAEKKKAIESGSVEDLAKFKGKLTNEEYNRAFMRLQNEKKVADMVAANQKTVWDKIDKGMAIVQKVGGYANTIATAKENFSKLDKALNGEKNDAAKEAKKTIAENEKNRALTQITNITELDAVQKKFNLSPDDYSKGLKILSTKEAGKKVYNEAFVNQDKVKEAEKKAKETPQDGTYRPAEAQDKSKASGDDLTKIRPPEKDIAKKAGYDNSDPSDFVPRERAYEKTPKTVREKAGYVNPDGESSTRTISGYKKSDKPVSYKTAYLVEERSLGTVARVLKAKKDSAPSKPAVDAGKKVADEYATRMANVRAYEKTPKTVREKAGYVNPDGESSTRTISGYKKSDKPVSYKTAYLVEERSLGTVARVLKAKKDSAPSKPAVDAGKKVADEYATRMANVRATYDMGNSGSASSSKRTISGAKTGNSSSYKQQTNLDFGGSKVSKFSAKAPTPSKVVTDTRQTVASTQAERARQKEVDKKRKAKIK